MVLDKYYPLSDDDIRRCFNNQIKIIKYSQIKDYDNVDDLLAPYDRVMLLWEYKKDYGHWCCLYRSKGGKNVLPGTIWYFDSFGTPIEGILKKLDKKTKSRLDEHEGYLIRMFKNRDVYYNTHKLQGKDTSVCGRYCIGRMVFDNLTSDEFRLLLTIKGVNKDDLITFATEPLLFS